MAASQSPARLLHQFLVPTALIVCEPVRSRVLLLWDALAPEMDFVEAKRVVTPAKSPLSYEGFAFPCGYRETDALRLRVQPPPYFIVSEVQHLLLSRQ